MADQRPMGYPKATDLVQSLLDDVDAVLGTFAISDDDMKSLRDKFHITVRRHRHEQERFGKKWKRARVQLKAGPAAP